MHGQNHIQNLKNISFFCKFLPLLHTLHNCIAFKAASFTSIMLHILSSRYYNDLLDLQLSWTLWNCRKESWNEKYSGCTGHKNTDPLKEMQHTEVIFTISSFFLSFFLSFFISFFLSFFFSFCEVIQDRERARITNLSTPIILCEQWEHYKLKLIIIELGNLFMHMNARGKYEGWNFNSGNYLFTTDTK